MAPHTSTTASKVYWQTSWLWWPIVPDVAEELLHRLGCGDEAIPTTLDLRSWNNVVGNVTKCGHPLYSKFELD